MEHRLPSYNARRHFLAAGLSVLGCAAAGGAAAVPLQAGRRGIAFHNLHTGESADLTYWADGAYVPDALARIDHLLRDFRTGETHPIDRRLLDLLVQLNSRLESNEPFQVISGSRSPATNAMLASSSEGVARRSLHMDGLAIDIRVANRPLAALHKAALDLRGGGVGYYPASDFVHVDVGRVRNWG